MRRGMVKGKYANVLRNLTAELRLRNFTIKTIETYVYHNNKFLEFIDKSPKNVKKDDIKNYLIYLATNKEVKPNTFNLILSSLKFYYEEVLKKRFKVDFKRAKLEKHIPTVIARENIARLIEITTNLKHKVLIMVIYSSGLRVSECVSIKIKNLYLENKRGIIRKGKGRKDRYFMLSEIAVEYIKKFLKKRKDNNSYLFNDHQGHLSVRSAQQIVKRAVEKARIKERVFCHAFRSSLTTHLYEDGVPLDKIQKLLGHSRIDTTLGYIKSSTKFMDDIENPLDKLKFYKKGNKKNQGS